jgi:predicted nucleotidyltransferase
MQTLPSPTPSDQAREREIKAMIVNVLRANAARLEGRKVVLFGSRARGEAQPRSDFDLGVVGDQPMPLDAFFAIQDMLEELPTLYRIDWVDFARAGEKLKERALRNVEVLHG